jgi:hypothetical protein
MTPFLKSTGTAKEHSTVVFLHRVHEQLVGDDGRYFCKVGFKNLRQKTTKYSISSYDKKQFVVGKSSRLIKNNRSPAKFVWNPDQRRMGLAVPATTGSQFVNLLRRELQKGLGHYTGGQALGAIGSNQPLNDTGEQGLACMRYKKFLSILLDRLIWAAGRSQPSFPILEKAKARQGSRRARKTPRMATTMN